MNQEEDLLENRKEMKQEKIIGVLNNDIGKMKIEEEKKEIIKENINNNINNIEIKEYFNLSKRKK